jgi:squalene-hopene/tetraprenyl-beta-curcumene cyclase
VDNAAGIREREKNLARPATSEGNSRSELPTLRQSFAAEVIREGVRFLINSIRPDGSWPIDTNLATWNTTLAINALAGAGEDPAELLGPQCLDWLLSCQHTKRHPFTGADPGGFGWTDLSGAVPDADDTPGALLALHAMRTPVENGRADASYIAAVDALRWLLRLQNRDGGWPTFCRGWGRLPFDRSGTDLTAHALRAITAWETSFIPRNSRPYLTGPAIWEQQVVCPRSTAIRYLSVKQHPDGSWSPLWFGNQDHPEEDNPVYGTAKVLMAYRDLGLMDSPEAKRGVAWLVANQNADGGWGSGVWARLRIADCGLRNGEQARSAELGARSGVESEGLVTGSASSGHSVLGTQYSAPGTGQPDATPAPNRQSAIRNPQLISSVEETALAIEALLAAIPSPQSPVPSPATAAVEKGLNWLIDRVEANQHRQPAPIGFYFGKLWYYERLYPLTFTVAALGRACRQFAHPEQPDSHAQPAGFRAP